MKDDVQKGRCGGFALHKSLFLCTLPSASETPNDIRQTYANASFVANNRVVFNIFDATPNTPEGDTLAVLTLLVQAYEDQQYPILPPDPIEALLYHMESRGLTHSDLEPYIGNRTQVAAVLERRRPLSLDVIRRLHSGLGISADVLIQPYALKVAA